MSNLNALAIVCSHKSCSVFRPYQRFHSHNMSYVSCTGCMLCVLSSPNLVLARHANGLAAPVCSTHSYRWAQCPGLCAWIDMQIACAVADSLLNCAGCKHGTCSLSAPILPRPPARIFEARVLSSAIGIALFPRDAIVPCIMQRSSGPCKV